MSAAADLDRSWRRALLVPLQRRSRVEGGISGDGVVHRDLDSHVRVTLGLPVAANTTQPYDSLCADGAAPRVVDHPVGMTSGRLSKRTWHEMTEPATSPGQELSRHRYHESSVVFVGTSDSRSATSFPQGGISKQPQGSDCSSSATALSSSRNSTNSHAALNGMFKHEDVLQELLLFVGIGPLASTAKAWAVAYISALPRLWELLLHFSLCGASVQVEDRGSRAVRLLGAGTSWSSEVAVLTPSLQPSPTMAAFQPGSRRFLVRLLQLCKRRTLSPLRLGLTSVSPADFFLSRPDVSLREVSFEWVVGDVIGLLVTAHGDLVALRNGNVLAHWPSSAAQLPSGELWGIVRLPQRGMVAEVVRD